MPHDELYIELSAYADGELGAEPARVLEEKLRAEPALRRELELYQKMDRSAAAIPVPQVEDKLNALAGAITPKSDTQENTAARLLAAAREAPSVSEQRFNAVWQKLAAQTIAPPQADRDAMLRSAWADGEQKTTVAETQSREAELWRKLDHAAAELHAPQLSELAWREAWHNVALQTVAVNPAERRAVEKIERAAAKLPVPVPGEARFAERWILIAGQLAQSPAALRENRVAGGAPRVSDECWNALWKRIAARMNTPERQAAPAKRPPATSKVFLRATPERSAEKAIHADFTAAQSARHSLRWGWMTMAGAAAVVLLAATLFFPRDETERPVAFEIPEALDERYDVQVQYLQSQREPVVCFFLKSNDEPENTDKVKDWKWLPD